MILNLDERGRVSRYYPQDRGQSLFVAQTDLRILPGSIVLDDFVGQELIVLLHDAQPFGEDQVRESLRAAFEKNAGRLQALENNNVESDGRLLQTSMMLIRKESQ